MMIQYSEIEHKKQSFVLTATLFLLLFLLFFLLKYNSQTKIDQLEGGGGGGEIAVNFGNSELGSGKNFESMEIAQPAPKSVEKEQIVKEELVTNESDNETPVVASVKKPKEEPKKVIEKPVETPKPKPSKSTTDALSNLLNSSNSKSGDGDDDVDGNKGKVNGNTKAIGYNGGGGSGGGNGSGQGLGTGSGYGTGSGSGSGAGNGNWKLAGRKLSNSSKQVQKCNEYGTVVVQITVNRNGNVIAAKYAKGTTNTSQCLLEPAYATAKSYKWQPDVDAPETQIGYITINFKLSE
jgi:outer membrane biosynthesis protein TonB